MALLTGPRRAALSGVSTHVELLLGSEELARSFDLIHFEVGREGREEGRLARAVRLLVSPFLLAWQVLARRAAIVHVNTALTPRAYWRDLVYVAVARLCGARVLYQVHGGPVPQAFCRGRVAGAFVRATLGLADAIVVLSSSEREAFCRFGVAARVLALPNAVDCSPYDAFVRERAPPARPLRLLYLGRLVREKGLYELIEGLQLARSQGAAAELVVAGDGAEAAALREAVAAGGRASVGFVGPVRGPDKLALLSWADVLALPSYSEGLPYALLESMAAGVPAIASRVGAIPEVVADGVNGLLLEPHSAEAIAVAIHRLTCDRAALARMSEASRATISARYSISHLAAELGALYTSLVRGRGRDVARA